MRNKIFNAIFSFIKKHPIWIIIVSAIFLIAFIFAFKFIPLQTNYINLLPQKAEPVQKMKILSKKLKGVGQFSIAIESKSADVETMQRLSDLIYTYIRDFPEIEFVQYKLPREFLTKNALLFIDLADLEEISNRLEEKIGYEMWKEAPLFVNLDEDSEPVEFNIDDIIEKYKKAQGATVSTDSDYMISKDKKLLVLFIKPDFMPTEVNKTGKLIKKIKTVIEDKLFGSYSKDDISISFAGSYTLSYDQKNAIYSDIKFTSVIALIAIFIAILIFIRRINLSFFLLYSLVLGVLSAFGIAFITIGHINLITGFLLAILAGLGINYGIHFLYRYNEENRNINGLKIAFIQTGKASLTGALTTAISFLILVFSKFLGFSEFGFLSSFSIMFTLVSIYIVTSSFILLTKKKSSNQPTNKQLIEKSSRKKSTIKRGIIYTAICLFCLTLAFGFFLKNVKFEYNSKKLEVKGQKSIEVTQLIQQKFNISTDPTLFYTHNRKEEEDFYKAIKKKIEEKESLIGNILSISSVVSSPQVQQKKIEIMKKIVKQIDSVPLNSFTTEQQKKIVMLKKSIANIKPISEDDLPIELQRRFFADDNGKRLYISQIFPNKILFDAKEMQKFVDSIKRVNGTLKTYYPTGMHILYVFLIKTIIRESKIFVSLVFIIIWILLLIDFKNIKDSLIVLTPLVFGILWLLEIMGLFGIKLNFMNIIVFPTILGTGVDNGVHIYHRYKETKDILFSIKKTGPANLAMSLTVAIGWASLFFAHYEGLKTMAFVGVIGILLTFVASLTIMPFFMLVFKKR